MRNVDELDYPCGCRVDVKAITFTKTCQEHTRILMSHMIGVRTIDIDDVEWILQKEAAING